MVTRHSAIAANNGLYLSNLTGGFVRNLLIVV